MDYIGFRDIIPVDDQSKTRLSGQDLGAHNRPAIMTPSLICKVTCGSGMFRVSGLYGVI